MNKIYIIIYFLTLCGFSFSIQAQQSELKGKAEVTGLLIDQTLNEPLPFVSIAVKGKQDDRILGGQISDQSGQFKIASLPAGEYVLEFQFIGYKTLRQEISISRKNEKIDLGEIYLEEEATQLDGVEVVAERSTLEQRIDRKVINIGKDLATTGPTAADLMANIPSVTVDTDGAISLRGNENVRILVDGKPTNLNADQLLQQIPSTSIQKIELITNPSAKFIPDGMSGIINIVLHKNTSLGWNGNVTSGFTIGEKYRFSGSAAASYKAKKVNFFLNYGNTHGTTPTYGRITRPDDPSHEVWTFESDRVSHLIKTGVDYSLSQHTILSAYTIQNRFSDDGDRGTTIYFPQNELNSESQQYFSDKKNETSTYNLDLTHDFKGSGTKIEFEVDYSHFSETDDALFVFSGAGVQADNALEVIQIDRKNTTVNLDFTTPINSAIQLQLGAELRLQKTDNDYQTTNPDFNNSLYEFDRDIYSGYFNYSHKVNKWSYQIGARVEGFEMVGELQEVGQPDETYSSPIFSVYPSLFFSYVPDPEKQKDAFNFSISRRVDRPNLVQVTPIRVWSSPRITNIGNPALVPQFTNSVEFNYTRQFKEGSITTGIFARRVEDEITRFAFSVEDIPGDIFFSYNNYRNNTSYGFEVSGNYRVSPKWSFTSSFDLYMQKQRGVIQDELREVDNVLYNFRMNHSFKVNKRLILQLVNLYRGPNTNLQYKRLSFHYINIGGRYSVFDGNGTISLNFNDIFKTQQNSFDADRPVIQEGVFDWDSRTVFIGYSHRFGTGNNQSLKRKKRDRNETRNQGF